MNLEEYRHNDYQLLLLAVLSYSNNPQIELKYN